MAEYDLVIRNTTIATAADGVKGDIGISAGRVVALGERLDRAKKEIDASGLIAVPGGIDAHIPSGSRTEFSSMKIPISS